MSAWMSLSERPGDFGMRYNNNPEAQIKNLILDWLFLQPSCFVWQNDSVGIYDSVNKTFRKRNSKYCINGVSDILGIWRGKPLAIEVKSKTGVLSENQKNFLIRFKASGGIGFMARSLDDVTHNLGVTIF